MPVTAAGPARLESSLGALDRALSGLRARTAGAVLGAIDRWRSDADAIRFHLRDPGDRPPLVAIVGGTGTGKSTLANRLLGAKLTATSFRRTFTSGAVAIAADPSHLPERWLSVGHRVVAPAELPARGQPDALAIIRMAGERPAGDGAPGSGGNGTLPAAPPDPDLSRRVTLIDTPDLDGDQPAHHAQADRVFRWAQGVIFLVTPEKYQMTELLPYYRLARRYAVPALFVMNKAEETAVVEDYGRQLAGRDWPGARVFALPRDDAAWEPPPEMNLAALRAAVVSLRRPEAAAWRAGLVRRAADLLDRLHDQVIQPLRADRAEADRVLAALKALESPEVGLATGTEIDVNPLTQQLQKRLQQRSVLYLMGPQRILERVRQVPGMVLRLPRTLWDVVVRGQGVKLAAPPRNVPAAAGAADGAQAVPDFEATVTDQFAVVQSRIDDVLRDHPAAQRWIAANEESYRLARMDPQEAGRIAREELRELERWLEQRWNATPRDTLLLMKLLRHLPGGEKLTQWTEAAPYLLAVVVATHHAFFGPVDLIVIAGFSLATWLSEKLSNEVSARARATNQRIAERFGELTREQIAKITAWIDQRVPPAGQIESLEALTEGMRNVVEEEGDPE